MDRSPLLYRRLIPLAPFMVGVTVAVISQSLPIRVPYEIDLLAGLLALAVYYGVVVVVESRRPRDDWASGVFGLTLGLLLSMQVDAIQTRGLEVEHNLPLWMYVAGYLMIIGTILVIELGLRALRRSALRGRRGPGPTPIRQRPRER